MLREVWPFVDTQHRAGRPVVLARPADRDGPGARPIGATMAVAADGTWRGSLSGGCVEGIVLDHARAVLGGAPAGVSGLDRLAGPAGLDLGGAALAETALSILAEFVAVENGRTRRPLRGGHRSIRAARRAGISEKLARSF